MVKKDARLLVFDSVRVDKHSETDDDSRPEDPLVLHKSDSGITRHLKTNSECLSTLSKTNNLASFFTILARARNDIHVAVLEAILITSCQPVAARRIM